MVERGRGDVGQNPGGRQENRRTIIAKPYRPLIVQPRLTACITPFKFFSKNRVLALVKRHTRVSSVVHAEYRVTKGKNEKWMPYAVDNDGDDPAMISANYKTNKDKQGIPTLPLLTRGQTNSARYACKNRSYSKLTRLQSARLDMHGMLTLSTT